MCDDPAERDDILKRVHRRLFSDGAPRETAPRGNYEFRGPLGEGGMGLVWRFYDRALDRELAVKVVRTASPGARARLLGEGRALARVSHPNVVQIFAVEALEDEVFLMMEFVAGETLCQWARGAAWPDIVRVLAQAGQGLVATHARGLAHRDIKPANVLVQGGNAKVIDYGLARAEERDGDASQEAITLEQAPGERTRTGTLVGTPGYMAPEQHEGRRGDACSDQFSFCVTAWEVLYGVRPFAGGGEELLRNILAGCKVPPPAGAAVPARVRAVLERGLAADRAARWPDMSTLLAALTAEPRPRLRRLGLAATGLAVAAALWAWNDAEAGLCSGAYAQLDGVWDFERRSAVEQAILATRAPFARTSADAVVRILDEYAHRWTLAHADACEATHRRGEQSEARLDQRMRCLDRHLGELEAVARVIEATDPTSVHAVVQAAQRLPAIDACVTLETEEGATSPAVDGLRASLAQVRALQHAGRPRQAHALAEQVARAAEGVGDGRVKAEAAYHLGRLAEENGDYPRAEALLRRTYTEAERLGLRGLARDAAWRLGTIVGYMRERVGEGDIWADVAESKAAALSELAAQGQVSMLRATLAATRGEVKSALLHDETAVERLTRALGPDDLYVARAQINLAVSLVENGQHAAAEALLGRVHASLEATLGAHHPDVANVTNELGNRAGARQDFDEAARHFARALAIWSRTRPSNHPDIALALKNLGVAENRRGRPREALEHLTRSLTIRETKLGPEHSETLSTVQALAVLDVEQGRFDRARVGYHRVLAARERSKGRDHASLVPPLYGLGSLAEQTGEPTLALALAERAEAIDLRGPATAYTGALARLLGRLLLPTRPKRALEVFDRDAGRIEAAFGPEHPDVAKLRADHAAAVKAGRGGS